MFKINKNDEKPEGEGFVIKKKEETMKKKSKKQLIGGIAAGAGIAAGVLYAILKKGSDDGIECDSTSDDSEPEAEEFPDDEVGND